MTNLTCPNCGFLDPDESSSCRQCGTSRAGATTVDGTEDINARLEEVRKQFEKLNDDLAEKLTPVRTTSFNGFGIMLLDYRQNGDEKDVFEATRWVTAAGFPLIPLGVWRMKLKSYKRDYGSEKQSFNLLSKGRLSLDRIAKPYLIIAIGALPFVLSYFFLNLNPLLRIIDRNLGTWAAVGLIILLIILCLVWFGYIMTRFHNVDRAYKKAGA